MREANNTAKEGSRTGIHVETRRATGPCGPEIQMTVHHNQDQTASFKAGDRVVITAGSLSGRHGTVIDVQHYVIRAMLSNADEHKAIYRVKTDPGYEAVLDTICLQPEKEPAAETVPDIEIDGGWYLPEDVWKLAKTADERAGRLRGQAERARKPANSRMWRDEEAKATAAASNYREHFYRWAASYPELAGAITGHKADAESLARYYRLHSLRSLTATQEREIELFERRSRAMPERWSVGDGVGYRVIGQINRGFRIAALDRDRKLALVRQVADTGLTIGGGTDRIPDTWVAVGDLIADHRYDAANKPAAPAPEAEAQAAALAAPGNGEAVLRIERYSDKAVLLTGDTKAHVEQIRELRRELGLHGGWMPGKGWIFPVSCESALRERFGNWLTEAAQKHPDSAGPAEAQQADEAAPGLSPGH